jgi:ferric-dicitrate binding protein FerR (iron transport regulator)
VNPLISPDQLDRYLTGTASDIECVAVEAWLAVDPAHADLARGLAEDRPRDIELWLGRVKGSLQQDAPGIMRPRLQTVGTPKFHAHALPRNVFPLHQSLQSKGKYVAAAAAAIVGFVMIARPVSDIRDAHDVPEQRYATKPGQRATVALADGTRAHLGPATTLVVANARTQGGADVRVSGEVLFSVAHRSNTSFQVHTQNAVTRVLGTTFLVRRYPADRVTQVVVADGRVSLTSVRNSVGASVHDSVGDGASRILTARMRGTVNDSGSVLVTPNIAVEDYTAWTTGRLVFRDALVRDVVAELGRAYDVEMRIADSALAAQHISWTIPLAQRSLRGIVESLVDILDARAVRAGRVITFVPGRSSSRRPAEPRSSSTTEHQYGK